MQLEHWSNEKCVQYHELAADDGDAVNETQRQQ